MNLENIRENTPMRLYAGLALACMLAMPAFAVDGVTEINQVRANAGLVTPTDAAGFPVTIGESGSYRLTGNLLVTNVNTTAIEITVPNVTLDLNGFEIRNLFPGSGTGDGIFTEQENVTIHNGTIRDMGRHGILVQNPNGLRASIRKIRALNNGASGIATGAYSIVEDCIAADNATFGITGNIGSILRRNIATGNSSTGLRCSQPNTDCVFIGNHSRANGLYGIEAGAGSLVSQNSATRNANVGLRLGNGAGYGDNVLDDNNGGGNQVQGGDEMGTNVCQGNTTCP